MLYAALGDSITYGYSSSSDATRYVNRLQRQVRAIHRNGRINVFVTAKPGWTSKQLLKAVRKVPVGIWEEVRLVTLLVGGNDAMRAAPWLMHGNRKRLLHVADQLQKNLSDIIQMVKRPQAVFIVGTIYNPFPNSAVAEECTEVLNRAIRKAARQHRVWVADLGAAFNGQEAKLVDSYRRGTIKDFRLIRANPVHPNDQGHLVISRAFLRTYRQAARARGKRRVNPAKNTKKMRNIGLSKNDAT